MISLVIRIRVSQPLVPWRMLFISWTALRCRWLSYFVTAAQHQSYHARQDIRSVIFPISSAHVRISLMLVLLHTDNANATMSMLANTYIGDGK